MSKRSILSSEELDYIRQVFSNPRRDKPLSPPSFEVEAILDSSLLSRLKLHTQLKLEARQDHYRMFFPLHLAEDEQHHLQLELGAPSIYEEGTVLRPWRLPLQQPPTLLDSYGAQTDLQVHEIAPGSLLVCSSGDTALPERFALWLPLPGVDAIPIKARRVRQASPQCTAYSLQFKRPEYADCLRQFLFTQYQQRHPELQTAS